MGDSNHCARCAALGLTVISPRHTIMQDTIDELSGTTVQLIIEGGKAHEVLDFPFDQAALEFFRYLKHKAESARSD